jgi:hypothetical protein
VCLGLVLIALSNSRQLGRTPLGHIVRRFCGQPIPQQMVNDLSDDLRYEPLANDIQKWSLETMNRFSAGNLRTNQNGPNWPIHAVVVAPTEIPEFINHINQYETPEVAVGLTINSKPECIIIDWYTYGLVVGPTNTGRSLYPLYDDLANEPIKPVYCKNVRPGFFVIWFDNK